MDAAIDDARWLAVPFILIAVVLQYLNFAKKPMSFPCCCVSERMARRCVLCGLLAELCGLHFLPLCEAYPMNVSFLVVVYFWRDPRRSRSCRRLLACLSALSPWVLPWLNENDRRMPRPVQAVQLLDSVLRPDTCILIVGLLCFSVIINCVSRGGSAFGSCTPPGLNFGLTAVLLKTLVQVVASIYVTPHRPELWVILLAAFVLFMGVRSASSKPLRRAMEAFDSLSVLAFYGVVSSVSAAVSGAVVFNEMSDWDVEHQALYAGVAVSHCWGMCCLGRSTMDVKGGGHASSSKHSADEEAPVGHRKLAEGLQMAEVVGKGSSSSPVAAIVAANSTESTAAYSGHRTTDQQKPALFSFEKELGPTRTVDDDAQMEDELFAHALGSLHVEDVTVGGADWATWGDSDVVAGGTGGLAPQFDADFDEIMRRFNEDDRRCPEGSIKPITDLDEEVPVVVSTLDGLAPPSVEGLTYDAQDMLDGPAGLDLDEDELLNSVIQGTELPLEDAFDTEWGAWGNTSGSLPNADASRLDGPPIVARETAAIGDVVASKAELEEPSCTAIALDVHLDEAEEARCDAIENNVEENAVSTIEKASESQLGRELDFADLEIDRECPIPVMHEVASTAHVDIEGLRETVACMDDVAHEKKETIGEEACFTKDEAIVQSADGLEHG